MGGVPLILNLRIWVHAQRRARFHQRTRGIQWNVQIHGRRWWQVHCRGHHTILGNSNQCGVQNEWDGKWVVPSQTGGTKYPCLLIFPPAASLPIPSHTIQVPAQPGAYMQHQPRTNNGQVRIPRTPPSQTRSAKTKEQSEKSNLATSPNWH